MLYMKCEMLALANPKSGESAAEHEKRGLPANRREKKQDFPFLRSYKMFKNEPKWQLDVEQHLEVAPKAEWVGTTNSY